MQNIKTSAIVYISKNESVHLFKTTLPGVGCDEGLFVSSRVVKPGFTP